MKRKIKKNFLKVFSSILSISMIITSMPIAMSVSASNGESDVVIPKKEDEGDRYNPEFSYDEEYYNGIIDSVKNVKTIGKLPTYEEFAERTGYVSTKGIPLTDFRDKYGIGDEFTAPTDDILILITSIDELDLLSSLVNEIDDTTSNESSYYSKASYKVFGNLEYTEYDNQRFIPIGTKTHSFNGTFDGNGYEISGLKIHGDARETYEGVEHFGLFGYIGKNGIVKNLGIVNCDIELPYVVGADVGIIAGRNYGTVDTCYINSKSTTKVHVSNSTVGGIAENYGTIKNMYSDFYAEVKMTDASYSDPQPIATVNKGTVTDSYYIKWENKHPTDDLSVSDDSGTNKYLVGWASEDYSNFSGTGVSDEELATLSNVGLKNFVKGSFTESSEEISGREYNLTDFRNIVGMGTNFKKSKADTLLADSEYKNILVIMSDEWQTFCDLCNGADSVTSDEQKYFSTVEVYLGGTPSYYGGFGYTSPRSYTYMDFDAGAKPMNSATLGTSQYPYNGVIHGNNCKIRKSSTSNTIFGVLGNKAKIYDIQVVTCGGSASYFDEEGLKSSTVFCSENNGLISNCSFDCGFTFYDYETKSKIADDDFNNLLNSFNFIQNNKGTVSKVNSIGYFTWQVEDYSEENGYFTVDTKDGYFNAISLNSGTVDDVKVGKATNFNNIGTFDDSLYFENVAVKTANPFSFNSNTYIIKFISKYPTIGLMKKPKKDSNGNYLIYTPEDLNYFIVNGKGENLILMNTIDMCDYLYDGSENGYFNINGTLTNEDDISSYIDLGTGTKCYSILNLNVNGSISKSFGEGKGSWNNIYFIGGSVVLVLSKDSGYDAEEFTSVDNWGHLSHITRLSSYLFGGSIYNVHYNFNTNIFTEYFDESLNAYRVTDSDGNLLDIGSRIGCIAKSADLCSSGGTFSGSPDTYGDGTFVMLGKESTNCDSYAILNEDYNYDSSYCYCIGYDVYYSKTHSTYVKTESSGGRVSYGIGHNVYNCVFDSDSISGETALFGVNVYDSVYRGNIDSNFVSFGSKLEGFVFDTDGVLRGIINGMSGNNILFKGTIKVITAVGNNRSSTYDGKSHYLDSYVFNNATNVINIGKVVIDVNSFKMVNESTSSYTIVPPRVSAMGKNVSGKMNGTIEFEGSYDDYLNVELYYYGDGIGANYSNINFNSTGQKVKNVFVFYNDVAYRVETCPCENYGNIVVSDVVDTLGVGYGVENCINYGDISVSGVSNLDIIRPNGSVFSLGKNYGNVFVDVTKDLSTVSIIRDLPSYGSQETARYIRLSNNIYNAGNVEITSSNGSPLGYENKYNYIGYYGDKNYDSNSMFICYSMNYGSINVHDIQLKNTIMYISEKGSLGDVKFTNVDFDCCNLVGGAFEGYRYRYYSAYYNRYESYSYATTSFVASSKTEASYPDLTVSNCVGTVRLSNAKMKLLNNNFKDLTVSQIPYIKGVYEKLDLNNTNVSNVCTIYYSDSSVDAHDSNIASLKIRPYTHDSSGSILVNKIEANLLDISCNGLSDVSVNNSTIKDSIINTFASSKSEDSQYTISNPVNYGNVSITGLKNVKSIKINQDEKSNNPNESYINTGSIIVKNNIILSGMTENAELYVSGVCGVFNNNKTNTGVLNTGSIDVEFSGDIYISGIGGGSEDPDKLYNCINIGNIKVKQLGGNNIVSPITKVGGISCNATREANGVINWGDIEVSGIKSTFRSTFYTNNVVTATVDVETELHNAINYGDVTVYDDPQNSEFTDFYSVGVYTSSIYDIYHSMKEIPNLEYIKSSCSESNILNYGKISIINGSENYHCGATLWSYPTTIDGSVYSGHKDHSIVSVNSSCDEGLLMNRSSLKNIIKQSSVYRYRNLEEDKYISVDYKLQYNGANDFEYADSDELRGKLAEFISDMDNSVDGAYVLTATQYQLMDRIYRSSGTFGGCLEDSIKTDSDREISTKWGKVSLNTLLSDYLKQRDENTWVEFGWQEAISDLPFISSVDRYNSVTGSYSNISEKSTLIRLQEPVSVSINGKKGYPNNTIVTEMSLYMPLDDYDLSNMSFVRFKVNGYKGSADGLYMPDVNGEPIIFTKGSKFKVFKNPVIIPDMYDGINRDDYSSDEDYDKALLAVLSEKIGALFESKDDILDDKEFSSDKSFDLPINNDTVNKSFSLILGVAISEDGRRSNLLVLNVIPKTINPQGSFKSIKYSTGINNKCTELIKSDYYNESDYTVSYGTTEFNGSEWKYPIYTMKNNMYHYSDGAYVDKYDIYSYGYVVGHEKDNAITATENNSVYISFSAENIKGYKIYVDDKLASEETIPISDLKIADDGATVRINSISKYITSDKLSSGGKHVITVYGVPYYGESSVTPIILQVVVNREKSPENYIKSDFFRRDSIYTDGKSSSRGGTYLIGYKTLEPFTLDDMGFTNPRYTKGPVYSSLATVNDPKSFTNISYGSRPAFNWDKSEYSDFVQPEGIDTYYPTKYYQSVDIIAENGDIATYSMIKEIPNKLDKIEGKGITSKNNGTSAGNTYILPQDELKVNFEVDYRNAYVAYETQRYNSYTTYYAKLKYVKVYDSNGVLVSTVDYKGYKYGGVTSYNCVWGGIVFYISDSGYLYVYTENSKYYNTNGYLDTDVFVDDYYTFVPVLDLGIEDHRIEMGSFVISKSKLSVFRAVSVKWNNTLVTSSISTLENELSNDVDIYGDGRIDYSETSDDSNVFYIENCVEPNCSGDIINIDVPITATLQENVDGEWVSVFESTADNHIYTKDFSYDAAKLAVGSKYNFRIIAQDYDESDDVKKTHVAYYNTNITATLRNKDITIEFATDDEETMSFYREILEDNGNTSIQIKNMNGADAVLQQTKLYTGTSKSDMKSTFYKLAQGDYAIDVQTPVGYKAKVKIVGGSSEGFLIPSNVVKGDRLRLPYANSQSIKLVVYLERSDVNTDWGVTYNKSLFHDVRENRI